MSFSGNLPILQTFTDSTTGESFTIELDFMHQPIVASSAQEPHLYQVDLDSTINSTATLLLQPTFPNYQTFTATKHSFQVIDIQEFIDEDQNQTSSETCSFCTKSLNFALAVIRRIDQCRLKICAYNPFKNSSSASYDSITTPV